MALNMDKSSLMNTSSYTGIYRFELVQSMKLKANLTLKYKQCTNVIDSFSVISTKKTHYLEIQMVTSIL